MENDSPYRSGYRGFCPREAARPIVLRCLIKLTTIQHFPGLIPVVTCRIRVPMRARLYRFIRCSISGVYFHPFPQVRLNVNVRE